MANKNAGKISNGKTGHFKNPNPRPKSYARIKQDKEWKRKIQEITKLINSGKSLEEMIMTP